MDEWVYKPILSIFGFIFTNFFRLCYPGKMSFPAQIPGRIPDIHSTKAPVREKGGNPVIT
jgi:hypothetical protein